MRQEAANATVLFQQLAEIGVVRRSGQAVDLSHGCFKSGFGHGGEDHRPEVAVVDGSVEHQGADLAQGEGGGIEVTQTAQSRFPAFADRVDEHPGDEQIEKVEHVILRARLQCSDERQQGGGATLVRQPGDRVSFGGAGKARQRQNADFRQPIGTRQPGRELPHLVQPLDRAGQFRRALQGRPRPEPVHRALPAALRQRQQGVEPFFLVGRDPGCQQTPQATAGAGPHPREGSFEHARPRQQHFVRNQPRCGAVEECARPIRSRPAQRVKPA